LPSPWARKIKPFHGMSPRSGSTPCSRTLATECDSGANELGRQYDSSCGALPQEQTGKAGLWAARGCGNIGPACALTGFLHVQNRGRNRPRRAHGSDRPRPLGTLRRLSRQTVTVRPSTAFSYFTSSRCVSISALM
jgi:hypothetical protein